MSAAAAAYLLTRRWRRRLAAASDAVQTGLWLGVLGRDALAAVDETFYREQALYASEAHNLRGLYPWEEEAIGAYFGGCRSLLLVGAGGGREVLPLVSRGYRVEAYECNPVLATAATALLAREGCAAAVRPLPRDQAPPPGERRDGVVVGWGAYMLIPGRERRVRFLAALRGCVDESAPLLLSFWTRREGRTRDRIVPAAAAPLRWIARREPVEPGDDLAPNFVHRFTEAEVAAEMAEGGFSLLRYRVEGREPHTSGWAVGVAA